MRVLHPNGYRYGLQGFGSVLSRIETEVFKVLAVRLQRKHILK